MNVWGEAAQILNGTLRSEKKAMIRIAQIEGSEDIYYVKYDGTDGLILLNKTNNL